MKEATVAIIGIFVICLAVFFVHQQITAQAVYAGGCSQESVPDCAGKSVRTPCPLNGEMGECIPLYKPEACLCMSNP